MANLTSVLQIYAMNKLSSLLFLLICVVTIFGKNECPSAKADVTANIYSQKSSLSLHAPVVVNFALTNNRTDEVLADLGSDFEEAFELSIYCPDGQTVKPSRVPSFETSAVGRVSLQPGQTFEHHLLLNKWFDFSVSGRYIIKVQFSGVVHSIKRKVIVIPRTWTLSLEINPEDENDLNALSEGLFRQIIEPCVPFEKVSDAAFLLSFVHSPVAAPYITEAIEQNPMVVSILIPGLERIGGAIALNALMRLTKSKDQDTRDMANDALRRIGGK